MGKVPRPEELRACLQRRTGEIGIGLPPGTRFGHYRIESCVGRGGQGQVFEATDERLRRRCALKLMHVATGLTETARARLRREGELAARIEHPGVCQVLDAGVLHGIPFLATQWIDGEPLGAWLVRAGPVPPDAATRAADLARMLTMVIAIGEAIAAAHTAGVLHRDIKPSNILVRADGRPVVIDFGIADDARREMTRLTHTGQVFGTPGYMAPEQADVVPRTDRGERIDVFALGVLTFELLTRARPFADDTHVVYVDALRRRRRTRLRDLRPDAPRDLETVLERALAVEPLDRPPTVAALVAALRECRDGAPSGIRAVSRWVRWRRWAAREPWLFGSGVAVVLVLGVALAVSLTSLDRAQRERYRAGITAAAASAERGDPGAAWTWLRDLPPGRRGVEWRLLCHLVSLDASSAPPSAVGERLASAQAWSWNATADAWWLCRDRGGRLVVERWPDGAAAPDRNLGPLRGDTSRARAISPSGTRLLGVDAAGDARVVDPRDGVAIGPALGPIGGPATIRDDGALLWAPSPIEPVVWRGADGRDARIDLGRRTLRSVGFDRSGGRALIVSTPIGAPSRGRLSVVDLASRAVVAEFAVDRPAAALPAVELDDGTLVMVDGHGTLLRCDPLDGAQHRLRCDAGPWHTLGIDAAGALRGLSADGTRLRADPLRIPSPRPYRWADGEVRDLVDDPATGAWLALDSAGTARLFPHGADMSDSAPPGGGGTTGALRGVLSAGRIGDRLVAVTDAGFGDLRDGTTLAPPPGWLAAACVGAPPHRVLTRFRGRGAELAAWHADGTITPVTSLDFLPAYTATAARAAVLACAAHDGSALLRVDLGSGAATAVEVGDGIRAVALQADGRTVLVGSATGELTVVVDGRVLRRLPIASGPIHAIEAIDGEDRLVIAIDGGLQVVDAGSGEPLLTWPIAGAPIRTIRLSTHGEVLAIGSASGEVRLFRID